MPTTVTKFTGEAGLTQLISLIKANMVQKVHRTGSSVNFKVLSDNDLTDTLKGQYDAAYTHSQQPHAPASAQENVIETVKVNGSALPVSSKAVDVPVPLISTDISADSGTDLKATSPKAVATYVADAIAGITGMSFRILTTGEYDEHGVPTITGSSGYIYLVPSSSGTGDSYVEWIYVNNSFEKIGTTDIDLSEYLKVTDIAGYTAQEIDTIWTSVFSASV